LPTTAASFHGSRVRTLVTGANRGIGLELVRQLRDRGDTVEACARSPEQARELQALAGDRVRIHGLDVTDAASVRALVAELGDAAIDILFNVAGVYGGPRQSLRQMAEDLELADVAETFEVNAIGPLRMATALLPHVRRGKAKKLVHLTSGMGSITDNTSGGYYAYRMSKTALNMMSRSLAVDLAPEGIISVVINPGWVQTDMGGATAPTPVADSVRGILREIDKATLADSGEFLNWKGNRYAW
jgi:NAD(P)-dependent dehydrogenase (short-subunit alcohol dehydrogenase family)